VKLLKKHFDNTNPNSSANKFRRKRFKLFLEMIEPMQKPVKVLDIGGTENFWEQMNLTSPPAPSPDRRGEIIDLTILNIEPQNISSKEIHFIQADALELSFIPDKSFDVVFSNSVIEHVGGINEQAKFADEVKRISKRYFIQTPNYYFPFEPHFLFPCFQFLPRSIQTFLVMKFNLGWFNKCRTKEEAELLIDSVHLLKKKELKKLFAESKIHSEKFLLMNKSFIVIK